MDKKIRERPEVEAERAHLVMLMSIYDTWSDRCKKRIRQIDGDEGK
jgi:hypothetical protein